MSDGTSRRKKIFHMSSVEYKDLLQTIPVNKGVIGEAIILLANIPTTTNTVVIGAETYTFLTTPLVAKDVLIGTVAASKAALAASINANTALYIIASVVATGVKIQFAQSAAGKAKIGTPPSYVLSETLANGADVWNQDNLNTTGQTNHLYQTITGIQCTAKNLDTEFTVPLAFTPTELYFRIIDADGLPKPSCTGKAAISGNGIVVTFDDGASAAIATDVIVIMAYGSALI